MRFILIPISGLEMACDLYGEGTLLRWWQDETDHAQLRSSRGFLLRKTLRIMQNGPYQYEAARKPSEDSVSVDAPANKKESFL